MPKNAKLAASLTTAKAGVRKRDVIDVRPAVAPQPRQRAQQPTPEQMRHADYEEMAINDKGANGVEIRLGRAYRRVPLFETLAKTSDAIDDAGLAALRFYRAAFDAQDASPTRCTLNDEGRGVGLPLCIPFSIAGMMLDELQGGTMVDALERGIGALLPTLRAVALEDRTFSAIAIDRFGGRKVPWIETQELRSLDRDGKRQPYVEKIAPRSGAHRAIIADEFAAAVKLLTLAHAPHASTARQHSFTAGPPVSAAEAELAALVAPASPSRPVDPAFFDDAGHMRPMDEISVIIRKRVATAPESGRTALPNA